jgi:hypothetical protein
VKKASLCWRLWAPIFEEQCQELLEISTEAFEGIQNELVAEAIAKFQCVIAG